MATEQAASKVERGGGHLPGNLIPRGFPAELPSHWVVDGADFSSKGGKVVKLFGAAYHRENWKAEHGGRTLFVVHGLGEHGGRYAHFPHYLKDDFDLVFAMDYRGHGRAEGIRGHADRFDDLVDDVAQGYSRVVTLAAEKFGGTPSVHFFAHSLGGLIGALLLQRSPATPLFASVTLSAPLVGIAVELPFVKRAAAHVLSRAWSRLQMKSEVDSTLLSHDPEVGRAYKADLLVHEMGTPKFYTELLGAISRVFGCREKIAMPIQVLQPLDDRIVSPEAVGRFYEQLQATEKILRKYPGFFHEPHNEVERERVFADMRTWVRKHSI